jgi:hypothetical protein
MAKRSTWFYSARLDFIHSYSYVLVSLYNIFNVVKCLDARLSHDHHGPTRRVMLKCRLMEFHSGFELQNKMSDRVLGGTNRGDTNHAVGCVLGTAQLDRLQVKTAERRHRTVRRKRCCHWIFHEQIVKRLPKSSGRRYSSQLRVCCVDVDNRKGSSAENYQPVSKYETKNIVRQ